MTTPAVRTGVSWGERFASWGSMASVACAIHCLLMPIAVAVLPTLGVSFLQNEWLELGLVLGSAVLVTASLSWSCFSRRRTEGLVIGLIGVVVFLVSACLPHAHEAVAHAGHAHEHAHEHGHGIPLAALRLPLLVIGALGMAAGTFLHRRACRSCADHEMEQPVTA
ncbi:MAG: MerC domain-containing protein [Acidobacteriota bacterium]